MKLFYFKVTYTKHVESIQCHIFVTKLNKSLKLNPFFKNKSIQISYCEHQWNCLKPLDENTIDFLKQWITVISKFINLIRNH